MKTPVKFNKARKQVSSLINETINYLPLVSDSKIMIFVKALKIQLKANEIKKSK